MIDITKDKLQALNTIALWVLAVTVVVWLCFRPDNTISKDTVEKLTVAVDKIAVASENMNKVAIAQREWTSTLQKQTDMMNANREAKYKDIFKDYDYTNEDTSATLSQLYATQLRESAQDNGSADLRGLKDGTGKTGTVQKPTGVTKGATH